MVYRAARELARTLIQDREDGVGPFQDEAITSVDVGSPDGVRNAQNGGANSARARKPEQSPPPP